MNRRTFLTAVSSLPALAAPPRFIKSICSIIFSSELSYPEKFRQAREAGFAVIEMRLGEEIPMEMPEDEVKRIGEAAHKADIAIASIWVSQPLSRNPLNSPDPALRQKGVEVIHKAVDIAAWLDCGAILLVPGRVGPGAQFQIGYQETWDRFSAELPKVIPYAAEKKVLLTPENVSNKFLLSPLEMRAFIDQFHSPYLQAHFDVGNVMQWGFPEDWILTLGPRIKRLHVKDFKPASRGEAAHSADLLEGSVDWPGVMAALVKVGYSGFISPEIGRDPNDPDKINKISHALDKIISMA